MFSLGYFIFDLLMLYKTNTDMTSRQNKIVVSHHYISILGLVCSLIVGYGFPSAANFLLLCEISTIFMNYRNLYKKEELMTCMPIFFSLLLALFFTIVRIILFPIMTFYVYEIGIFAIGKVGVIRRFCILICITVITLLYCLYLYWFRLILRGIGKLCGCIKINKKADDRFQYEDEV